MIFKSSLVSFLLLSAAKQASSEDANIGRLVFSKDTEGKGLTSREIDRLVEGGRKLTSETGRRRLKGSRKGEDVKGVLIRGMDCAGCIQVNDTPLVTRRQLAPDEPFVKGQDCDQEDEFQVWNLLSLEPSDTWYHFENEGTGECMRVVGSCFRDVIRMAECDKDDPRTAWAIVGGNIMNYYCMRTMGGGTPRTAFLEANCGSRSDLNLDSFSSDSTDHSEMHWVIFPAEVSGSVDLFDPDLLETDTPSTFVPSTFVPSP